MTKTNFPTKKILVVTLILNVFALVAYSYLFFEIKNKNEDISISKNILSGQVSREGELKFVGASLKNTEKDRTILNSYFVQKGKTGVANFVEDIEGIASLAGVSFKINSILIKEEENVEAIEVIDLGFEVKGGWSQTVSFLKFLELLPYKISFERVYIENNSDNSVWNNVFNISALKLSD